MLSPPTSVVPQVVDEDHDSLQQVGVDSLRRVLWTDIHRYQRWVIWVLHLLRWLLYLEVCLTWLYAQTWLLLRSVVGIIYRHREARVIQWLSTAHWTLARR